jgi:Cu(I)/Ag(I) efflux system membrane fusion protein/cobalt-zinc-cadmium efflux system membrane fusion protein
MNTPEQSRNYRKAFFVAIVINLVLMGALGLAWWKYHRPSDKRETQPITEDTAATEPNFTAQTQQAQLTPIQLTPQRMQSIGVKFGTVGYKNVSDEIRVTGNVDADETRISSIQVRFPGWIRKVYVDATYRYVRKGEPLFTIYSPDLVATEQEYLLARQNQQQLNSSTVAGVSTGAASLANAARERLTQWEVPQEEISKLESTGKVITDLTFNAPASGYIFEKNVLPNMYVQPDTKLYTVADLSTVWVNAQVFQPDIGKIKPGDAAQITVDAYPGKTFSGRVGQILPQVDASTRTVRVRLVLPNPQLKLKPGMYVNVVLKVPLGRQLVVQASAVLQSGTRQVVFVNRGEGNLEPRKVMTGARVGDEFIVTKGLKPGESIVTSANFLIDSESQLQAASGSYVPPPPGAGGAGATGSQASQSPQANAELSTEPSPPHKGSNVFRVKLTNANNSPIAGAQVVVTFYMPAMPAMGMAAMNTRVTLTDRGNGVYEGKGDLGSGGTWQVTITATQNGQTIASNHFTVNAEGGM